MKFASKHEAAKFCKSVLGHSVHYDTGSCGDCGRGSREYFHAPDAPMNKYSVPEDKHSTISRVGRFWSISDFTRERIAA